MILEGDVEIGLMCEKLNLPSLPTVFYFFCYHHFLKLASSFTSTSPLLLISQEVVTSLWFPQSHRFYLWLIFGYTVGLLTIIYFKPQDVYG